MPDSPKPILDDNQLAEKRDWLSKPGGKLNREECLALLDTIDALKKKLRETQEELWG